MAQASAATAVQNIYRTPELWDKIKFTFFCLLLYRVGAHVTVPGVDVVALTDYFANQGQRGLLLSSGLRHWPQRLDWGLGLRCGCFGRSSRVRTALWSGSRPVWRCRRPE